MSLKMKLTASISAFVLVLGLMLMGVFAVNQATVNMGGSINFTATDVYARVTGKIENAQGEYADKELPTIEFSAENGTPDQSEWSNLNLLFDDDATPIVIKVTVENLSAQNTLRVNLNDTLSSTVGNLEKVVKNDGEDYTNQTDITLQPNGQENDSTTFTITMSVTNKNNSVTADFDYELNLFDQYYVETYDYFTFKENGDGTVELTAFDEGLAPSTNIVIPSTVSLVDGVWMDGDEFDVTSIGDRAFYGCSGLTGALDLSNCTSLTSIGDRAFEDCSGLTSITLPSSLASIGEYAFLDCRGLETLEYKDTIEQWLSIEFGSGWMTTYHSHTFIVNGEELTNLIIPEGVTSIGEQAFGFCDGLTSIILPLSLTSIGNSAFRDCKGLETLEYKGTIEQWLSIGKGKTWISDGSHKFIVNGEELTNLIIPEGVASIGNCAFYGCVDITSVTFPSSLKALMFDAFFNCDGLTEVDLSNCTGLNVIYSGVFENCTKLESIKLPSPKDWFYSNAIVSTSGTPMDMSDPQQNADWLTVVYRGYAGKIFHRNV